MEMHGTIILERVKFYARHGVDPQERLTGANFYVTLEADADFTEAMRTDAVEDTVSYAMLYDSVKDEMERPSQLLEHVAGRIVRRIFNDFPRVTRIRLRLTKENPPMEADCREAGITVDAAR